MIGWIIVVVALVVAAVAFDRIDKGDGSFIGSSVTMAAALIVAAVAFICT